MSQKARNEIVINILLAAVSILCGMCFKAMFGTPHFASCLFFVFFFAALRLAVSK